MRVRFTEWLDERDYPYASIEPVISDFPRKTSRRRR